MLARTYNNSAKLTSYNIIMSIHNKISYYQIIISCVGLYAFFEKCFVVTNGIADLCFLTPTSIPCYLVLIEYSELVIRIMFLNVYFISRISLMNRRKKNYRRNSMSLYDSRTKHETIL